LRKILEVGQFKKSVVEKLLILFEGFEGISKTKKRYQKLPKDIFSRRATLQRAAH